MSRVRQLKWLAAPLALLTPLLAAPLPSERPDGLIWLQDLKADRLAAYRPDGRLARQLDLPKGVPFLGLTPDGRQILYAKLAAGRLTYHVRALGTDTPGRDLGLDYSPFDSVPMWTRDGKKFIRVRGEDPKRMVGVRSSVIAYAVFDLGTNKLTPLDLPSERWVTGWTPDEKGFVTLDVGLGASGGMSLNYPGKVPTPLTFGGTPIHSHRLAGAADGRTLLVPGYANVPTYRGWYHALWAVEVGTGRVTELIREKGHGYTEAGWSPDGKRLCLLWGYVKDEVKSDGWDEKRLTVARADGTGRVTVTLHDKAKGQDPYRYGLIGWFPAPR